MQAMIKKNQENSNFLTSEFHSRCKNQEEIDSVFLNHENKILWIFWIFTRMTYELVCQFYQRLGNFSTFLKISTFRNFLSHANAKSRQPHENHSVLFVDNLICMYQQCALFEKYPWSLNLLWNGCPRSGPVH